MHDQFKMQIIANDLDSMVCRIEDCPAHPKMTEALNAVQTAKTAIIMAMGDLHEADMCARYSKSA